MIVSSANAARPTSIDLDIVGDGSFSVQAVVSNTVVFETAPVLLTSSIVRHFKFRAPKQTDFGLHATWSIAVVGDNIKTSCIARFSSHTPVTVFPSVAGKPVDVAEGLSVQELPRQWRYAPTVAK